MAFRLRRRVLGRLKQGEDRQVPVPVDQVDTLAEELIEWADAVRGRGAPEAGGEGATGSLAVVKAAVKSVKERRHVEVAEILAGAD